MGDVHVDERNSPPVVSPEEMAGRFHGELIGAMPDWKRQLGEDPSRLAELEHEVHEAFSRGADLVVAGLIALTMKHARFDEACEQTRQNYRFALSRGRTRSLRIRLFGGLLVWVTASRVQVGFGSGTKRRRGCTSNWRNLALAKAARQRWKAG